jgi:hypothetical protein
MVDEKQNNNWKSVALVTAVTTQGELNVVLKMNR